MSLSDDFKRLAEGVTKGPFSVRECVSPTEGVLGFGIDRRGYTDRMIQMPKGDVEFFAFVGTHRAEIGAALRLATARVAFVDHTCNCNEGHDARPICDRVTADMDRAEAEFRSALQAAEERAEALDANLPPIYCPDCAFVNTRDEDHLCHNCGATVVDTARLLLDLKRARTALEGGGGKGTMDTGSPAPSSRGSGSRDPSGLGSTTPAPEGFDLAAIAHTHSERPARGEPHACVHPREDHTPGGICTRPGCPCYEFKAPQPGGGREKALEEAAQALIARGYHETNDALQTVRGLQWARREGKGG